LPAERGRRKLLDLDAEERAMTTVKLERWRAHLTAARTQGMSLAHYARAHGISRYTLYAAQRQLRSGAKLTKRSARRAGAQPNATPFIPVQVAAPARAAVRARLANGVELEFGQLDTGACATLVRMLAALPCSG
jgi:hypothetical protein